MLRRPNTLKRGHRTVALGVWLCLASAAAFAAPVADDTKLVAANTGFAFDLLKQIAAEQPQKNVFISPFSVSTVLQMVGNGAGGQTGTEMQNVLKTMGLSPQTLNAANKDLNQSLNSQTNVILNLANAIWYQDGFHLKPGFVSVNRDFFGAKLASVDFARPASAQAINGWADQSTRGKIKEVVQWPFPSLTRVVLANAIYFKGKWADPFDKKQTKPHDFHLSDGQTRQAPLMWKRQKFGYQEGDGFQAVRLPYAGGRLEMIVFLPATNSSPARLLAGLNSDTWRNEILPHFEDRDGTVALPRFKIEFEVRLNDSLEALGLKQAFTPVADFSLMATEPLYVSEVKQKAYVDVNEEGTEAAAVTTTVMRATGVFRREPPFEMIVDRPFVFVISDSRTQSILFMGVILYPTASAGN